MEGSHTAQKSSLAQLVEAAQLVEVARRELEHDREAAKASLATVSTILQSEIERHSGARGGLAGWQVARVRAFIDKNLDRTIHTPGAFFSLF